MDIADFGCNFCYFRRWLISSGEVGNGGRDIFTLLYLNESHGKRQLVKRSPGLKVISLQSWDFVLFGSFVKKGDV